MKRDAAAEFIQFNVLGSQEVQDFLLINRSRLAALVNDGKLKPVKVLKKEKLFLLSDVEAIKAEMLKDTRTNLYKTLGGGVKNDE